MSENQIQRSHPQTEEDKQPRHYFADWWVYLLLVFFIGGLVFLTYALTLRGDVINEFGKPSGKAAAPGASAAKQPK